MVAIGAWEEGGNGLMLSISVDPHLPPKNTPVNLQLPVRPHALGVSMSVCSCLPLYICTQVLVLTVEPGFGGQSFKADAVQKCRVLRAAFPDLLIEVDGGINAATAAVAAEAGANVLVAGSAIFGAPNPQQAMVDIRQAAAALNN